MDVITSWRDLIAKLMQMSEEDLRNAINFEVSTYRRKAIISRLHARYSKLRAARERELLIKSEMLL